MLALRHALGLVVKNMHNFFFFAWDPSSVPSTYMRWLTPAVTIAPGDLKIRYIHTYIHTHIHTYIHTYIHAYIHTNINTYIHTYIHTYIDQYRHTNTHT